MTEAQNHPGDEHAQRGAVEGAPPATASLWCVGCGYDLAGLEEPGRCPECAVPLRQSLAWREEWCGSIGGAAPEYRAAVARGSLLAAWSLAAWAVLVVGGVLMRAAGALAYGGAAVWAWATLLLLAMGVWGVWIMTARDPSLPPGARLRSNQWAARAAAVGIVLLEGARLAMDARSVGGAIASSGVMWAVRAVMLFALLALWVVLVSELLNWTRWLAARLSSRGLLRRAKLAGWVIPLCLLPVIGFGSAGGLVGVLILAALLGGVRARLNRVEQHVRGAT